MKKFLFALMGFVCAIAVNCTAGAVGAVALGAQPVYGMLAVNGVSFLSGMFGGFMPSGAACAGLYTEAWTGFMSKAFRTDPEGLGWYTKIRSFDQYVENDIIHFVNIGGDPTVLVNNTSYPLDIEDLEDGDKVKVSVRFRGREMAHPELGTVIMQKFTDSVAEYGTVEKQPKLEGRSMTMFVASKSGK